MILLGYKYIENKHINLSLNIRFLFLSIVYRYFHLDPFDLKNHKGKICNPTSKEKRTTSTIKCELVSYKPSFKKHGTDN